MEFRVEELKLPNQNFILKHNFEFIIYLGKEKYKLRQTMFFFHKISDVLPFIKSVVKLLSTFTNRIILKIMQLSVIQLYRYIYYPDNKVDRMSKIQISQGK